MGGSRLRGIAAALATVALAALLTPATAEATRAAPPPGAYWAKEPSVKVAGDYLPVVGDFNGDGLDDVFWYAPGPARDHTWVGYPDGTHGGAFLALAGGSQVSGRYVPLVGDFMGDSTDDIFWYGVGSAPDVLWVNSKGRLRPTSRTDITVGGIYSSPMVLHDGLGKDGIAWYDLDRTYLGIWKFRRGEIRDTPRTVVAGATPVVGDFDDNGYDDIFLYREGALTERVAWRNDPYGIDSPVDVTKAPQVAGSYQIVAGQLDGAGGDDLWFQHPPYVPGSEEVDSAPVWFGMDTRQFDPTTQPSAPGQPLILRSQVVGHDEVLLYGAGAGEVVTAPSHAGSVGYLRATGNTGIGMWPHEVLVGSFTGGVHDDLLNYGITFRPDQMYVSPRFGDG